MNSPKQLIVTPVSNLGERDIVHVKFYMANIANAFAPLRLLDERDWAGGSKPSLPANGRQVLHNAQVVGIGQIWPQIVGAGFVLFDAYQEDWKTEGLIVTLVFCKPEAMEEGEKEYKFPPNALLAINELTGRVWQYAHVYENPDGSTSIMVIGPRGGIPLANLEVKERQLNLAERKVGEKGHGTHEVKRLARQFEGGRQGVGQPRR